jgi:hypothetical protein
MPPVGFSQAAVLPPSTEDRDRLRYVQRNSDTSNGVLRKMGYLGDSERLAGILRKQIMFYSLIDVFFAVEKTPERWMRAGSGNLNRAISGVSA